MRLAQLGSKVTAAVAVMLGLVAVVMTSLIPEGWPAGSYVAGTAAIFGLVAALGAAVFGRRPLTVGVLVAAPIAALVLSSVLFAGSLEAFARHDLLVLAGAVGGAVGGAYIGARLFPHGQAQPDVRGPAHSGG